MSRASLRSFLAGCCRFGVLALVAAGGLAVTARPAHAQLAHARLYSIFPPGGQAGSEVEVKISGADLDEVHTLRFTHPGITATQQMTEADGVRKKAEPTPGEFVVKVADNVPAGIYEVRAAGRFGISNPRTFVVGTREELIEEGRPHSPAEAIPLEQGATVNGQADRDRVDYYRLPLKKGEEVLIECYGQKIDSRIDPALVLFDPAGRELTRAHNTVRRDAVLNFTAARDGDYLVGVYDFLYGGGAQYPYRLNCDAGLYVDAVFPPVAMSAGKPQQVTIYGRNLPGGRPIAGPLTTRRPLEQATVKIDFPPAAADDDRVQSLLPPRCVSAGGRSVSLNLAGDKTNRVTLYTAAAPVVVEREPANNDDPQQVSVPCEYVGQFYPARDRDTVEFTAKAGDVYWIEVFAHRLGASSDPRLLIERVVENNEGEAEAKQVAVVDDPQYDDDGETFHTGSYDPSYRLDVKEDGVYRLRLTDLYGSTRNDPRVMYRLVIQKQQPDFQLVAFPRPTKNRNDTYPKSTVLRRGGHAAVQLRVIRRAGFSGQVEITAEGLPQGVTCQPATIGARVGRGWLVFSADDKAPAWSGAVKITGKANIDGREVVREARGGTLLWDVDRNGLPVARLTRRLGLAVIDAEQAPLVIEAGDGQPIETSPGATVKIPVKVGKHGEVKGNVALTVVNLHRDIRAQAGNVKGDSGEVSLELRTDRMPLGDYSFFVQGTAKVRYERNQDAVQRAKQRQKDAQAVLAELSDKAKTAAAERDAANKNAQEAAQTLKEAEAALADAKQAVTSAAAQLEKAQAELTKAQSAGDNQTAAVKQARQQVEEAKKGKQQADDKLSDAQSKAEAAAQAEQEAQAAKKGAEQAVLEAEQLKQRAESYKKETDNRLKDVQNRNKPRDVDVAAVSSPVQLRIVEHPLHVAIKPAGKVKQGEKLEVAYSIERKYGLDGTVSVGADLPGGVRGVNLKTENLAKNKQQGTLSITAADDATPGKHTATLEFRCRLGRVNHQLDVPVQFEVQQVNKPDKTK